MCVFACVYVFVCVLCVCVCVCYSASKGPDGKDANFMFKCHRVGSEVFSVNTVTYHPNPDPVSRNVLATGGSEGGFCFWDIRHKHKISEYNKPITGKCVRVPRPCTLMFVHWGVPLPCCCDVCDSLHSV